MSRQCKSTAVKRGVVCGDYGVNAYNHKDTRSTSGHLLSHNDFGKVNHTRVIKQ